MSRGGTPSYAAARRAPSRAAAAVAALLAIACADRSPVGPDPLGSEPVSPGFSLLPLDLFGIGPQGGGHPCSAPAYRQFDFWVGNWDVFGGATANLAGTNRVKSLLDGCAVEENWVGAFGGTGRSLNAYDHATDTWSQMWVDAGGCPAGVILIEGRFADGSMTMSGRREQPEGFLFGPPCAPPPVTVVFSLANLIRWTPLASGSVLQQLTAAHNENPLPPLPPPEGLAGLRYDPVETVTPINVPRGSFCPTRAAAQQFNFMIGSWAVHQGDGRHAQGSATFSQDQSQCLVEEHFTAPRGYEGISYNTFDVFTQQWVRTYVDNQGQRLMLTGGLQDGVMVLEGTKPAKNGKAIQVRVSWSPVSADEVVQTWAFSIDGGNRWRVHRSLRYIRKA